MSEEKPMNLIILKTAVEDPELYKIISAIRGPDCYGDNLKWVFTCRIRALVARTCIGNLRTSSKVDFELIMEAYREAWNAKRQGVNVDHFLGHTYEALVTLCGFEGIAGETFRELYELRILAYEFMNLLEARVSPEQAERELKAIYDRFEVIKCEDRTDKEDK